MSKVVLYSAEWCGYCKTLKKYLDRDNVDYELRDVDDPQIRLEMNQKTRGNQTIPVVFVGDEYEINPSAGKVKRMLKRA